MVTVLQNPVPEVEDLSCEESSLGPLLQNVLAARDATHGLLAGDGLQNTVRDLVQAADSMGHTFLHGASAEGHALAGAMAFCSEDLRIWTPGQAGAVLLVDGVLAGTDGLAAAATSARAIGATQVDALVLRVLGDQKPAAPFAVEQLTTIS